jgi:hypothetical protein
VRIFPSTQSCVSIHDTEAQWRSMVLLPHLLQMLLSIGDRIPGRAGSLTVDDFSLIQHLWGGPSNRLERHHP